MRFLSFFEEKVEGGCGWRYQLVDEELAKGLSWDPAKLLRCASFLDEWGLVRDMTGDSRSSAAGDQTAYCLTGLGENYLRAFRIEIAKKEDGKPLPERLSEFVKENWVTLANLAMVAWQTMKGSSQ